MIENDNRLKFIPPISIILCLYIGYKSINLTLNYNKGYLVILLLIPAVIITSRYFYEDRLKKLTIELLKSQWGHKEDKKRNSENIKALTELFRNTAANSSNIFNNDEDFYIDDQTWQDLNMEEIYALIDRTKSTPGEQVLYSFLRFSLLNEDKLNERKGLIKFFQKNKDISLKIQYAFTKLDKEKHSSLINLLWNDIKTSTALKPLLFIMSITALCSIGSLFFLRFSVACLLIIIVMIINILLHLIVKNNIRTEISAITYLGRLIRTAKVISETISSINDPEIEKFKKLLDNALNLTKGISKKIPNFGATEGFDLSFDIFNVLFLIEEQSFYAVIKDIKKNKKSLKELYLALGELEAFISIASFRYGLESYCEPSFVYGSKALTVKDIVHPLIQKPVSNSISIKNGGIIITGSNMSGKSTFLRALGVNALLSQTAATALCSVYEGSFFKIVTSISPDDNIFQGKSYYLGEAEALLRIVKISEDSLPSLCIIDEIFRGTNPVERITAAVEILNYLVENNSIAIAATHDREITYKVNKGYRSYYFGENVGEKGLSFDYKIKTGVSSTRNAIKLLSYLGYPERIINNSNRVIESMK